MNNKKTFNLVFRVDGLLHAASAALEATHGLADVRLLVTAAETSGRLASAAVDGVTATDDVGVDGARHAVLHLQVKLGDLVNVVDAGLLHVSLSGGLNHVADLETLHSLILGNATGAVGTANRVYVAAALAVLTTITTFFGHPRVV